MCVMPMAILQLKERIKSIIFRRCAILMIMTFTAFMVIGRVVSGVHWITDIIGATLFSAGLVMIYQALAKED